MTVKRYKVTGTEPVLGDKMPGETFDMNMPEDQERFLIGISAIRIVSADIAADQRLGSHGSSTKKASPKKKG